MISLYAYQQTGAQHLASKPAALLADEPGLGKTVQAISASDLVKAIIILVLCPASARINWMREFKRFQKIDRTVQVIASRKETLVENGVIIISYDLAVAMHDQLMLLHFDVLILDESYFLKSKSAKRTQVVFGKKCDRQGGLASMANRIFALSGTPAPNNPAELWPLIRALFPEALSNNGKPVGYWAFLRQFCQYRDNGFGIQITGGKNLSTLRLKMNPYLLRRKKSEVLKDLPPLRMETLYLEPSQLLTELHELEAGPQGQMIRKVLQNAANLSQLSAHVAELRRLTGLAKVQPVIQFSKDALDGGLDKLVIFAHHREVIEQLVAGLKPYGAVVVHGSVSSKNRQHAIDAFQQNPDTRIFIGQITAAGTAITLTAASHLIFAEYSWVPAENAQAAMRIHRIGQCNPVLIRFATLTGSLDEHITETVRRKTAVLTQLFD